MSGLMFECPITHRLVETGIEIDYARAAEGSARYGAPVLPALRTAA